MNNLKLKVEQGIALVTLSRPQALNALNRELLEELEQTLKNIETDDKVRVVIITGEGDKAFVAGADIKEFMDYDGEQGRALALKGQEMVFNYIHHFPKPVIAAINGYALGGGLELALACHMRVASTHAVLGLPEVSLGLLPGYGGTQRLPMLVGRGRALEMVLTADPIGAQKALDWGILNTVGENALEQANILANRLLKRFSTAQTGALKAVQAYYNEEGFAEEVKQFGNQFQTPDFIQGVSGFINKKK